MTAADPSPSPAPARPGPAPTRASTRSRRISYGQTGQDILAEFLLRRNRIITREGGLRGTYVDIGCGHPHTGSNTFFFYERGWRGVCVDADPELCAAFRAARPRDTVVACGIGTSAGEQDFFLFDNPQHNSFNPARARAKPDRLRGVLKVPIRPLTDVLAEAGVGEVAFLSIDVEGFELEVLTSLDFARFRPRLVLTEALKPLAALAADPVHGLLTSRGYALAAHTGHDSFYLARD